MRWPPPLLLLASATCLLRVNGTTQRFVVTDVFLASAHSTADVVDVCQQNAHGQSVGVDWGNANADRVLQLCVNRQPIDSSSPSSATHAVQRIAVYSSSSSAHKPTCLSTEHELYRPKDSVVVCVRRIPMSQELLSSGNFLSDVWVSSDKNFNSNIPGWRAISTSVLEPADALLRRFWQWLWWPSYRGAFVTVQKPLAPIREAKLLPMSGDPTADACMDQFGTTWERAGDAALEAENGSKTVLCIRRGDTATSDRVAAALQSVDVIKGGQCTGSQDEITRIELPSSEHSLCLHWSASATSETVLNDLALTSENVLRGQFERMVQHSLNPKGAKRVYLYGQSTWKPIELVPEPAAEDGLSSKPPLVAKVSSSSSSSSSGSFLSFKILQIADLHYSGDPTTSCNDVPLGMKSSDCSEALMTKFVDELLELEKPDFVAFTGDNVQVYNRKLRQSAVDTVTKGVEARGIPYGVIFGNHDDERGFTRQQMMQMYVKKPLAYARSGPANVDGVGNYEISVQAPVNGSWGPKGSDVFRMYFLDSHAYPDESVTPKHVSKYDWIKPSQVAYYRQLAQGHLTRGEGAVVPAVMFFHIPLPEYALDTAALRSAGEHHEGVASSGVNMNLFASLAELGEVKATFCGHDHVNDYCYKRDGVQLCYGGGIGFGTAYGWSSVARRARVIEWTVDSENRRSIRSWRRFFGDSNRKHSGEVLYTEVKPVALPSPATADAV